MKKEYSYTQIQKYSTCGKMYQYHYRDRIRPKESSSALIFGSAMDEALNSILKDLKQTGNVTVDYKSIFKENLSKNSLVELTWSEHDYDLALLPDEEKDESIIGKIRLYNSGLNVECYSEIRSACLRSMEERANLLLDLYVKQVVPEIEEVIEVQKKIELPADDNTSFIGYIDAVLKFRGVEGNVIVDHKTSMRPYGEYTVQESQQLSGYGYALGLSKGAFIVLVKDIRSESIKLCPKCGFKGKSRAKTCDQVVKDTRCHGEWEESFIPKPYIQLIINDLDRNIQKLVVENISEVVDSIEKNVFNRNLGMCNSFYGKSCPYKKLCYYNSKEGLEQK